MKILVTGAPGTGKTTIAQKISGLLKLKYFSVKKLIDEHPETVSKRLSDGSVEVNEKLKNILEEELPKNYVIDTHLVEFVPEPDVVVILRTNPLVLKKRLEKRGYSEKKVRNNMDVEILDYFTQYYSDNKKVVEYDTSIGKIEENAEKIVKKIKQKKWIKGGISWDEKKYF